MSQSETKVIQPTHMKIKLSNWRHNAKPREFEWKTDKETWDKIACSLQEEYSTKNLSETQRSERVQEGLMAPDENITVWTGWTIDKKVQIKIIVGYPFDGSEYYEDLMLEGEISGVSELFQIIKPSKQEIEELYREQWKRRIAIERDILSHYEIHHGCFHYLDDDTGEDRKKLAQILRLQQKSKDNIEQR